MKTVDDNSSIEFDSKTDRDSISGSRLLLARVLVLYVSVVMASVILAHAIYVFFPDSDLPERLMFPVRVAFEFLDLHWKIFLGVAAIFFVPQMQELLGRLEGVAGPWGKLDFGPGVVHDKPARTSEEPIND